MSKCSAVTNEAAGWALWAAAVAGLGRKKRLRHLLLLLLLLRLLPKYLGTAAVGSLYSGEYDQEDDVDEDVFCDKRLKEERFWCQREEGAKRGEVGDD